MRVRAGLLLGLIGCSPVELPETPRSDSTPSSTPSSTDPTPEPTPMPEQKPASCLARYAFGSNGSVLDEQRAHAGERRWNDFAVRYAAAEITPTTHHRVELVERFRIADQPLLWFTPDYADAVVDATVFGELTVVDATRLAVGERVEIGRVTEHGRTSLEPRALAEFLLTAGVIQSFVHIGSTLCLLAEIEDPRGYRADFTGEHEYYTNEENHDPLGFTIEIAADGRLSVTGIASIPIPPER